MTTARSRCRRSTTKARPTVCPTENIALVRNTELAPDAPTSLMDMAKTGVAAVEAGEAEVAIGWQQPDVYHDYWVVTGAGGYVFGQTEDGA